MQKPFDESIESEALILHRQGSDGRSGWGDSQLAKLVERLLHWPAKFFAGRELSHALRNLRR